MASPASPKPPLKALTSLQSPHRPAPPITSRRLGALNNAEDTAQTTKNNAVSARMVEHGDAIVSLHDSTLINIRAKIAQLDARLRDSKASAVECEQAYVWAQPCGWDFDTIIRRFGYALTVSEIAALVALGEYNPVEPRFALQELSTVTLSKSKLAAKRGELKPTDRHADLAVADTSIMLYEYLHADVLGHAREELSRTDAGIQRVLKTIEHLKQMKDDSIRDTNIAQAEQCHHDTIDAYLELLEILNSRLSQLVLTSNDTNSFRGQAQLALDEARALYDEFTTRSNRLQSVLAADLARADEVRKQEYKKHKDAAATHRQWVKTTHDTLDSNAAEQQATFAQIQQLMEHMRRLSEQRLDLLHNAADEKQREEMRVANYNEFTTVLADHLAHLQRLKDVADNYCLMAAGLQEYLRDMTTKIAAKDVEGELGALTREEAERYLKYYRQYVFTTGDLVTKKELRVETLNRQRRLAQLQKDTAIAALDPDAKQHSERQADIDRKVDKCMRDAAKLRTELEGSARNFALVEEILQRHNVEYDHPNAQRGENAAEDKQRYVVRTLEFVLAEESAVEKQKEQLRRIKHTSENERLQRRTAREKPSIEGGTSPSASASPRADAVLADNERTGSAAPSSPEAAQPTQDQASDAVSGVDSREHATAPPSGSADGSPEPTPTPL
jgi:hypothetical protein